MHVVEKNVNFEDEMRQRFAEMGMPMPEPEKEEENEEKDVDEGVVFDSELGEDVEGEENEEEKVVLEPKFYCCRCGACCRTLDGPNEELFEELDNGVGICKFLDMEHDNTCTIYDKRPLICRVEEGYLKLFSEDYSWEEYLELNYQACTELRAKLGIPEPENPRGLEEA